MRAIHSVPAGNNVAQLAIIHEERKKRADSLASELERDGTSSARKNYMFPP